MYQEREFKNEEEFFQWNIKNENSVIKEEESSELLNYCIYIVKDITGQEIHCKVNNMRY